MNVADYLVIVGKVSTKDYASARRQMHGLGLRPQIGRLTDEEATGREDGVFDTSETLRVKTADGIAYISPAEVCGLVLHQAAWVDPGLIFGHDSDFPNLTVRRVLHPNGTVEVI